MSAEHNLRDVDRPPIYRAGTEYTVQQVTAVPTRDTNTQTIVILKDTWHKKALSYLVPFTRLESGWDGYKAQPISHQTAMFAIEVLGALMTDKARLPAFVPTASGAIQLEWHPKEFDFEVVIRGPYQAEYSFEDANGGAPEYGALEADLSPLLQYGSRL